MTASVFAARALKFDLYACIFTEKVHGYLPCAPNCLSHTDSTSCVLMTGPYAQLLPFTNGGVDHKHYRIHYGAKLHRTMQQRTRGGAAQNCASIWGRAPAQPQS